MFTIIIFVVIVTVFHPNICIVSVVINVILEIVVLNIIVFVILVDIFTVKYCSELFVTCDLQQIEYILYLVYLLFHGVV